ncbi:MAG: hypothetical protein A2341_28125 [Deltaproteobacteria bacterium RIFOXYB12_FULL_58_9]|nr:MAG: hypothetical protein A2341_28125 [Deltaproteobacteria bacterium RIFOXYB12_FULL_58_9]
MITSRDKIPRNTAVQEDGHAVEPIVGASNEGGRIEPRDGPSESKNTASMGSSEHKTFNSETAEQLLRDCERLPHLVTDGGRRGLSKGQASEESCELIQRMAAAVQRLGLGVDLEPLWVLTRPHTARAEEFTGRFSWYLANGVNKTLSAIRVLLRNIPIAMGDPNRLDANAQAQPYVIKGYDIVKRLGLGGFGEVFLCSSSQTESGEVAIKVLNSSALSGEDNPERRFMREAEALFKLKHRSVVAYHRFGKTAGEIQLPYLVMEFVDGDTLKMASASMTTGEKVGSVLEILDGLDHAHKQGVLHRDIKPSNVLVRSSDGQVTIVDFGMAYVWDGLSSESVTTHHVGSIGYVPPEVMADPKHRSVTHDIYSAGIVLYELVAGRRPNIQEYSDLIAVNDGLGGLDRIVLRATAAESGRYQTVSEFRRDLLAWLRRYEANSTIGPSPLISRFRSRLRDKRKQEHAAAAEREQLAKDSERFTQEQHSLVTAAARQAFNEIMPALLDNDLDFQLQDESEEIVEDDEPTIVLTLLQSKPHFEVNFGVGWDQEMPLGSLGRRGLPFDWTEAKQGDVLSPKRFLRRPFWVLFTAGMHQSPQRVLFGAVAAFSESNRDRDALLYGCPAWPSAPGLSLRQTPARLTSFDDIRDFVIRILASAFKIDLDE